MSGSCLIPSPCSIIRSTPSPKVQLFLLQGEQLFWLIIWTTPDEGPHHPPLMGKAHNYMKIPFSFVNASHTHHFLSTYLFHRHTCSSSGPEQDGWKEQEDSLVCHLPGLLLNSLPTAFENCELGLGRKKDATSPREDMTQALAGTLYSVSFLLLDRNQRTGSP